MKFGIIKRRIKTRPANARLTAEPRPMIGPARHGPSMTG
jgi:hypothetical protein